MKKEPVLCIIAGPNGAGKTTTTHRLLQNEWGEGCLYINPDNIALDKYGDWNSPEAILQAAKDATRLRYECLEKKEDFVFETVLSSEEKVEFVKQAHTAGFFIRIFFICTASPEINVRRIAQRYLNGGHEVPISKIFSRYDKSLTNIKRILPIADRIYFYDNSVDNATPQLLCRCATGKLVKQYTERIPLWAAPLLKTIKITN